MGFGAMEIVGKYLAHWPRLYPSYRAGKASNSRNAALLHLPEPQAHPVESAEELLQHLTGIAPHLCPVCGKGHLHPLGPLADPRATGPPQEAVR